MTPVEDIRNPGLRKTHFDQLLNYIIWCEEDGTYYGRKDYFDKRHKELKEWVEGIINMFER